MRCRAQRRQQVVRDDLAIARDAEQPAEPLQLGRELFAAGPRYHRAERPEGSAQPAGRDPHLVDRVMLAGPHLRFE